MIATFLLFAEKIDAKATVLSVEIEGNRAEVIVDRRFDMVMFPIKKKTDKVPVRHHYISDETNRDIWVYEPKNGWLKLNSYVAKSNS